MTAISDGITTLHPKLWLGFKTARESRTTAHPLAGGNTAITLAPSGPRTSAIGLLFTDEQESSDCETMLATPGVLTITEPDRPTHSMQFVVTGRIERELVAETARQWIVMADVQEVGAP